MIQVCGRRYWIVDIGAGLARSFRSGYGKEVVGARCDFAYVIVVEDSYDD